MLRSLLCGLSLSVCVPAFAADPKNSGPTVFSTAIELHLCVEANTQSLLNATDRRSVRDWMSLESAVWESTLDRCLPTLLTAEAIGVAFKAYSGNVASMSAFRDGLLVAERAYSIRRVAEWFAPKESL